MRNFFPLTLIFLGAVSSASAGSIDLSWNPAASTDLAGYRIYYGTSARNYTGQQDVGVVSAATVSGLANCSEYYLAVKGRNEDGDLSAAFSSEITGYPRPVVSTSMPSSAERGVRTTLAITGTNFVPGSTVRFSDSNIAVNSVTIASCTQLTADVTVGSSAATGPVVIEVRNADGAYGSASGLLTISAPALPSVVSVFPVATSNHDVSVGIRPIVSFSRVVLPSSIQPATVSLLDSAGSAVVQAAGSPTLSTDGKAAVIVPAANLEAQSNYRIRVRGGSAGVKALTGAAMTSDYVQNPGFNTEDDTSGPPSVLSATPFNASVGVSTNVEPVASFSEPMDRTSLNRTNVSLVDRLGNAVAQAAGSPEASSDGRSVKIRLATDLADGAAYRVRVLGGNDGVRDVSRDPMAGTFLQAPGFTTALGLSGPPALLSVNPADSATRVSVGVHPMLVFSEPLQPSTITPTTFALLDAADQPVMQGFGSPVLSPDGTVVSITPGSALRFSTFYRVRVAGGASGARDASGDPLPETFLQLVGFQTLADSSERPRVVAVSPASQAVQVPLDVRPLVLFSEPMDPARISASRVALLDPSGRAVLQASNSPILSPDGMQASLIPAVSLAPRTSYRVRVLGGTAGVSDLAGNALPGTYTQASGFLTVPDAAGPVISPVRVVSAPTSPALTWTTDEPADSRVFYRRAIDVVYQLPIASDLRVTDHAARIVGLAPSTHYDFYVECMDSAGNKATSPEGHFTTLKSSYVYLTIEAESGSLTAPVRWSMGPEVFRQALVDTPQFTPTGRATSPSGKSELSFYAPILGTFTAWSRVRGVAGGSGSWFESMDGAARRPLFASSTGVWEWVASRSYLLSPGIHVFELGGLDAQARADRVVITNDPGFVATEQPTADTTPPPAPQKLALTRGDRRTVVAWTNPASDAGLVVIRYRTDGVYPANPADGFAVASRPASSGADDSYVHTGLTNGTAYFYSLFAIDESGNVSTPARGLVTPGP